jgi:hypothetical protein
MYDPDKLTEILNKGGCLILHKNDLQRLRQAIVAGDRPDLFSLFHNVKFTEDKLGVVEEGRAIAVCAPDDRIDSLFRQTFTPTRPTTKPTTTSKGNPMEYWNNSAKLSDLNGKTIKDITGLKEGSEEVRIYTEDGREYLFYHEADCCESVSLYDFDGDTNDLIGASILSAEVVTNKERDQPPHAESWTWSFYKIETNRGGLWMRWLGESNGYYSEEVSFVWANKPGSPYAT